LEPLWECAPYTAVATIYDTLMADVFTERQRPLIESVISHLGLKPGAWADVACGTGTVACYLAEKGWRVCGCDVSEAMLVAAREKAEHRKVSVEWSAQDMRDFQAPFACDVASCFFDSLNILTRTDDLVRAFRAVARALRPCGYFLFDAVTPHQTEHLWEYCDQFHEGDGFFGAWEARKQPSKNVAAVTMYWFIRQENGLFLRADESHRIRGYTRREIVHALKEAGLGLVAAYEGDLGFLTPVRRATMRIDYIARKKE